MHEGKRIRELLAARGKNVSDLARAVGVTRAAADKWVTAETLGAKAWETASSALTKLGIDPNSIRPVAVTFNRERPAAELLPLLRGFSRDQLKALLQLLDAEGEARRILRAVVADRLERNEH